MTFGDRLASLRSEADMSRNQLSKAVDIHISTLYKYEANKVLPTAVMICMLADYFHVSADYILGRSNLRTEKEGVDIIDTKIKKIAADKTNYDIPKTRYRKGYLDGLAKAKEILSQKN